MKKHIENLGGRNTGSISKNTGYLVVGESPGPSKLDRARELGIKTINYKELMELTEDDVKRK